MSEPLKQTLKPPAPIRYGEQRVQTLLYKLAERLPNAKVERDGLIVRVSVGEKTCTACHPSTETESGHFYRGHFYTLPEICRQLGIEPVQFPVPMSLKQAVAKGIEMREQAKAILKSENPDLDLAHELYYGARWMLSLERPLIAGKTDDTD